MLAELAAANAAFSIIKQAVSNGKEIASAGNAIAEFVGAKEKLQAKAQKKGGGSDLEEFMALEKIKQQEEELKTIMIYAGRPGLWHDWQRFKAKARVARREAEIACCCASQAHCRGYYHCTLYCLLFSCVWCFDYADTSSSRETVMEVTMERFLAWKILPRIMMFVMTFMYIRVIEWFISLPPEAMTSQATALTATVTGAMTGAFAVWLGSEK